jgi:glutathione S-transferase
MLAELAVPYELTSLAQGDQLTQAHRARHPLGRVPVLDNGRGLLFESTAICLQLADLYPEAGLLPPPGSYERGLAYQWVLFAMTELESRLPDVSFATAAGDGRGSGVRYPAPGPERVAADTAQFQTAARAVEDALADRDYLVGGRFSVADLITGSVMAWADDIGLIGEDLPNVRAYLGRLRARPGYSY